MGGNMFSSFKDAAEQENAKNLKAFTTGVNAYFQTKTAKAQARAQEHIAQYQAETIRANKVVQDIQNRQQLDAIGRAQSALTANYNEIQGRNVAEGGAGNVDISSGSAAAVAQGNADRYAMDSAAIRRAYDLQQWQGESTLSMMEAQAKGYQGMASAYRTVANLQGSAWVNAIGAALISHATDTISGKYSSGITNIVKGFNNNQAPAAQPKFYDRALQAYTSTPVRH